MEFLKLIIGDEGINATLAFIFFALFGMMLIKIARYNIKKKNCLRANPPCKVTFSKKIWFDDNFLDFVLAFMTSFGMFRFFPDAFSFLGKYFTLPTFSDKMAYGLLLGLTFQYVFHKLMNHVSIKKTVASKSAHVGNRPDDR